MSARTRSKSASTHQGSRPGSGSSQDPGLDMSRLYDRPRSGISSRPVSTQAVDLDTSRQSTFSHGSLGSALTLGGKDYPIGTHIGTSGLFVIGDPNYRPANNDLLNTSQTGFSETSQRSFAFTGAQPIEQRGYDFEYWNWPVIRVVFIVCGMVLMLILLTATIILVIHEKNDCGAQASFSWWKGSSSYVVQVPAFRDSDNDNIGDLQGIINKQAYLKYMGIETVILTNLLPSIRPKFTGAVSFVGVDTRLGDMEIMTNLISTLHKNDIHVLLEMNFAYTSDQHTWFLGSQQDSASKQSKYNNYYIWSDDENTPENPLNNNPLWNYNLVRGGYYRHETNNKDRPLLNWDNGEVRSEMQVILQQWLNVGIDGFVISNINNYEMNDKNRHENMSVILKDWREVLDRATGTDDVTQKVLVIESDYLEQVEQTAADVLPSILDQVQLVQVYLTVEWTPGITQTLPDNVLRGLKWQAGPESPWVLWRMRPYPRSESNQWQVAALHLYMGMLPGNPCYQTGHEIGKDYAEDELVELTYLPLLWQTTTSRPYNPGSQLNEQTMNSLRSLMVVRQSSYSLRLDTEVEPGAGEKKTFNIKTLYNGQKEEDKTFGEEKDSVLLIERFYYREDAYYCALNFGRDEIEKDFSMLVTKGSVVADSQAVDTDEVKTHKLTLASGQAIVFRVQM